MSIPRVLHQCTAGVGKLPNTVVNFEHKRKKTMEWVCRKTQMMIVNHFAHSIHLPQKNFPALVIGFTKCENKIRIPESD